MNRIPLQAQEREILGKKVKKLRRDGFIPAHVFGNKIETEHVTVNALDFKKVYDQTGETGLIDLKIGAEKVRPVLVRDIQRNPVKNTPIHIDFYQVNLLEKVIVPVPVVLIGEEPELVHMGEAVVIQPISEVEVEALPADLPENIEVDITALKAIDDSITVSQLVVPIGIEIKADGDAVVVKLDNAVTEEMKKLMEEQALEQAAAAEAATTEEGVEGEAPGIGEEGSEGESTEGGEPASAKASAGEEKSEESTEEHPS